MNNFIKRQRFIFLITAFCLFLCFAVPIIFFIGNRVIIIHGEDDVTEDICIVPKPEFSKTSGFYEDDILLSITVPENTIVYYTLDCSAPTEESEIYEGPIKLTNASANANVFSMRTDVTTGFYTDLIEKYQSYDEDYEYKAPDYLIDKCNVIRAVAIDNQGNRSEVAEGSYFIGIDSLKYSDCMFVSIITDPGNLFDYENGIYVTGKKFDEYMAYAYSDPYSVCDYWWDANYRQKGSAWERESFVEVFDDNKTLLTSQDCWIRVQGNVSRGFLPRSLNLYSNSYKENSSFFNFRLLDNDFYATKLNLSCGGNRLYSKFSDYFISDISDGLNISTMTYKPCVLFLEGEYWGFYWICDAYDETYIEYNYGVDASNQLMIKNGSIEIGDPMYECYYYRMIGDLSSRDLSVEEEYEYACELIDIDSYIDYYALMAYISRQNDWPMSNYALWRSINKGDGEYEDCKWRWMVFDCNSTSMKIKVIESNTLEYIIQNDVLFASFWENEKFRESFKNRILYISEKYFDSSEINKFIDEYENTFYTKLEDSWTRFHGQNNNKAEEYHLEIDGVREFFNYRKAVVEEWFE